MDFDFAKWLDEQMTDRNMTNRELAYFADISESAISKYRRGDVEPGWGQVVKIAAAFGIPVLGDIKVTLDSQPGKAENLTDAVKDLPEETKNEIIASVMRTLKEHGRLAREDKDG